MASTSKVYNFVVVLKHKNKKAVQFTGILLTALAIFLFLYRSFQEGGTLLNLIPFFILLIVFTWSINQIRKKGKVHFFLLLIFAGFGFIFIQPFNWIGFFYLLMAFLERNALRSPEIGFSHDHIRFNGWPEKKYAWSEFTNIMLKDGILTMDFKNNKLFQKETDDTEDPEYDGSEEEFNQFCIDQLYFEKKPDNLMEN
jgi:hypothetical protein